MLFPWVLLFSLLTIHVDNYKQSEPSKVWIPAKPPSVSRNVNTNSNPQLSLESSNPKQLSSRKHGQPGSPGKNKVPGSSNGNTQLDPSDKDIHVPTLNTDTHQPTNHGHGDTQLDAPDNVIHVPSLNADIHGPIHHDQGLTKRPQTFRYPTNKVHHVPDPNSDPHQPINPVHGLAKRYQTSRKKVRSPGQAVMDRTNLNSVSSEEMNAWTQGKLRFHKIQLCIICIKHLNILTVQNCKYVH